MVSEEKAIVVRSEIKSSNEVERIFNGIRGGTCSHGSWVSQCMKYPCIYTSNCDDQYCEDHAPRILAQDAEYVAEQIEMIKKGVADLTRRGLPVSRLAAFIALLDLEGFGDEDPEDIDDDEEEFSCEEYEGSELACAFDAE